MTSGQLLLRQKTHVRVNSYVTIVLPNAVICLIARIYDYVQIVVSHSYFSRYHINLLFREQSPVIQY